jgi:hypothetical protein
MSTLTYVNTYTHSVTFVTDKMLTSLKNIIRWSGLDPAKLTGEWHWKTLELGVRTWLDSKHLEMISLEVYRPGTNVLVNRWDFPIEYSYGAGGDGSMWVDPDAIRYAIRKRGFDPAGCDYRIIAATKHGRPDVAGWGSATLLSTDGFVRHSVGTTIAANSLATQTAYWRKL